MTQHIPLTRGYIALVDAADYARVMQFEWHAEVHVRKHKNVCVRCAQYRYLDRSQQAKVTSFYCRHNKPCH